MADRVGSYFPKSGHSGTQTKQKKSILNKHKVKHHQNSDTISYQHDSCFITETYMCKGNPRLRLVVNMTTYMYLKTKWAATWENRIFAYAKTKTQISSAVTAKLISAFVFATRIVQSLSFQNTKFQASSHFMRLRSLICVGPGRKPRRPVFWRRGSNNIVLIFCWNH